MAQMTTVTGVILAAGQSRRFGATKQLALVGGQPLVRRVAEHACASSLTEVIVVVGHDADAVRSAVEDLPLRVVVNADYAAGQSTSVKAGLEAVGPSAAGVMFLPADQPGLTAGVVDRLVAAFGASGASIVVPVYAGIRGAPVTFPRWLFDDLRGLEGDAGGRQLLPRHAAAIIEVPFESAAPLADIDTVEDLGGWGR